MKCIGFAIAVLVFVALSSEAYAQNGLFGRLRLRRTAVQTYPQSYRQSHSPIVSSGGYYATSPVRVPTPATGYGANLHRNYMIRRAQQRAATTGIQPRNTGNILWSR